MAFSVGLPVIATRWNGIPELVNESCGMLIDPNSTEALAQAIRALERLKAFDSDEWTRRLHQWILETVS